MTLAMHETFSQSYFAFNASTKMVLFHFITIFHLLTSANTTESYQGEDEHHSLPLSINAQNENENNDKPVEKYTPFIYIRRDLEYRYGKGWIDYELPIHAEIKNNHLSYIEKDYIDEAHYYCPAETPEEREIIRQASKHYWSSDYCLFHKNFGENDERNCEYKPRPLLVFPDDNKLIPNFKFIKLYQFVYQLCFDEKTIQKWLDKKSTIRSKFLRLFSSNNQDKYIPERAWWSLYDIYYNTHLHRTSHTEHSISTPQLLSLDILPKKSFHTNHPNTEQYNLSGMDFNKLHLAFEHQTTPYPMVKQMLVPTEDFAIDVWQETCNHYVNIGPLWVELKPLMDLFNERIRKFSIMASEEIAKIDRRLNPETGFYIHTRIYNSPHQEKKEKLYLDNEKQFLIPDMWIKVVYFVRDQLGIAFYLHNTPGKIPPKMLCDQPMFCDFEDWLNHSEIVINDKNILQYGYCCKIDEQIGKLFSTKFEVESHLDLNEFKFAPKNSMNTPLYYYNDQDILCQL